MSSRGTPAKPNSRKIWIFGAIFGVVCALVVVLASGFMVETTNTDEFCASCHVMKPFRSAWKEAVHGGKNRQGFAAQCVDCHLPHGNFLEYLVTKAITGTSDVIHNLTIDGETFDWAANAEAKRHKFTYDSACRHCHYNLTGPGLPTGGLLAHRAYLRGETNKMCTDCHSHVGHKDMLQTVETFYQRQKK
ncbi:MAG: acetyl-CoA carboxyl transferase [Desulfuromonadales bacterium C00003068]|jgi:cytochrome c nitrite reductase small subunit|nr:NapC/NirT family cytochrome c [Deltaproteobacteria bacterium]OEU75274.1 MAG: acetyl-CoA carboxyl transferase [Desulfuromonadales bacterium C00003068]